MTEQLPNELLLEGTNAVTEALRAGRELDKILIADGKREAAVARIAVKAKERGVVVQTVDRRKLDALSQTGVHQGVIAFAAAKEYATVEQILEEARNKGEAPFVVLCDEITDPHNLGAILRSADGAGAHGVVIPKRRSVGLTAVVAKSAAGAMEYVKVARVTNLADTIDQLKKEGLWICGADCSGAQSLYEADLAGPIGLVIGSEGAGMGRLIREKCDFLVTIPMRGQVPSLNASVAGGILMYEILRQRIKAQ